MLEIFCNNNNKNIPVSLNEVIEYVPEQFKICMQCRTGSSLCNMRVSTATNENRQTQGDQSSLRA